MDNEIHARLAHKCELLAQQLDRISQGLFFVEGNKEAVKMKDFLVDSFLDIEFIVSGRSSKSYRNARITMEYGGPTIHIDTDCGKIIGGWGNNHHETFLYRDTLNSIDDAAAEMWESLPSRDN